MKTKISLAIVAVFLVGAGIIVLANRGGTQVPADLNASQPTQTLNSPVPIDSSASSPSDSNAVVSVSAPSSASGSKSSPHSSAPASNGPKSYTLAQVADHNSASSCWSAINGKVYDLTSWVNQHPGGQQAILSICGKDGSTAFNDQHGGQSRPANELAGFSIGVLSQ